MSTSPENLDLIQYNAKFLKRWMLGSLAALALSIPTAYGGFSMLANTQQRISEKVDQEMGAISVSELSQAQTITRTYEGLAKTAGRNREVDVLDLQVDQTAVADAYALEDLASVRFQRKGQLEREDFAFEYVGGMLVGILGGSGSIGSFLSLYVSTLGMIGNTVHWRRLVDAAPSQ